MALADDLLAQATYLAKKEPKRPKQASLRRAVSTAYYALFHLLTDAGARSMAARKPESLQPRIKRAFAHPEMKSVCQHLQRRQIPPSLEGLFVGDVEDEIRIIAEAFVALQEARHSADYDIAEVFDRADVIQKIDMVQQAFAAWNAVRSRPNATVFLVALLLSNRWR